MLKKWAVIGFGMSIGICLVTLCSSAWAQITKGKTRAAATKYLMRGVQQTHCKGAVDALKDSGPSDEKAWDAVVCHASCLNEMSYLLMDDGRCPDGVWAGATKELREGSAALLAAAEKRDLEASRGALKTVTGSCASCHKAHKAPAAKK